MFANYSQSRINGTFLDQLDWDQVEDEYLPVFSFLLVMCVFGVVGNSQALKVFQYFPVSSITILIKSMALVDLVTSGICIPLDMVQLYYIYPSRTLCKITTYIVHFCSLTTVLLLMIIAIERRRKIYSSLNHLSIIATKRVIVFVTVLAACFSSAAVIYYDILEENLCGFIRRECRRPESISATIAYEATVTVIVKVALVICTIAYIHIVHLIRRQIKREKPVKNPEMTDRHSRSMPSVKNEQLVCRQSTLQRLRIRKQRYQHSRKLTVILLIGTGISFVGYFLHVSATMVKIVVNNDVFMSIYQVLLRCYFLHSAVNPIIFAIVDERFRMYIRHIYSKSVSPPPRDSTLVTRSSRV